MIVVDLGCVDYFAPEPGFPDDLSIGPLIERFQPEVLYGFDPLLEEADVDIRAGTLVLLEPKAAWTYDGFVGIRPRGMSTNVFETPVGTTPCFDLARFIRGLPEDEIVVKFDVEGAEYPLLQHLHRTGADERIALILMEWHDEARISVRCPIEEWEHQVAA